MAATTSSIATALRLIQDMALEYPETLLNAGDAEPALSRIFDVIQENTSEREAFARIFGEMLDGERDSPEWLIAYCMRTLRWPEVSQAAEVVRASGDPAKLSLAWEVLDAHEEDEDWFGAHLFARHASPSRSQG